MRFLVLGVIVLAAVVVAALLVTRADDGPPPLTQADVNRAVDRGLERAQEEQRAVPPPGTTVYRTISPSLVTITTRYAQPGRRGLGTGFVINADGAVVTAMHVVERATQIRVRFADGTRASAEISSSEAANDTAILEVDELPDVVVPAVIGGSLSVGEEVFAVGNPLGLEDSLSAGVVSATDRSVPGDNGRKLTDLIQFDAAVNPGNSGGPLLNRRGHVVGIVTGLANPSDESHFVGIGFAVPIEAAGGGAGGPEQ
jgi:S1-C subfamily serine protease